MAHNLDNTTGSAAMAFRHDLPWHGLGANMNDRPNATDAEWMEASKTNYVVGLTNLYNATGQQILTNRRVMARMDTGHVFDTNILLSDHYKPIQNADVLQFARELTKNDRSVKIETIGALGTGETFWLLLDIGQFDVKKDEMKKFLLLTNNHNGKQCFRGLSTSVRVVCQNTLRLAMGSGKDDGFAIRHKGNLQDNLQEAQRIMGFALTEYDQFKEAAEAMAAKQIKSKDVDTILKMVFPDPEAKADGTPTDNTNAVNERTKVKELFEKGRGNDREGIKGTVWALLNGVTDYIAHWKNSGGAKSLSHEKTERRFQYVLTGEGNARNQQMFNLCMQFTEKGKIEVPKPAEAKKVRKSRAGGVLIGS